MDKDFQKICAAILMTCVCQYANAGLVALTIHSRANCVNNESITWWAGHLLTLKTISIHVRLDPETLEITDHRVETPIEYTWRSAAVHWGEAAPGSGWEVVGAHYIFRNNDSAMELLGMTDTTDCSTYNGWWD